MSTIPASKVSKLTSAMPLLLIPLVMYSAYAGGWAVLLVPFAT